MLNLGFLGLKKFTAEGKNTYKCKHIILTYTHIVLNISMDLLNINYY